MVNYFNDIGRDSCTALSLVFVNIPVAILFTLLTHSDVPQETLAFLPPDGVLGRHEGLVMCPSENSEAYFHSIVSLKKIIEI